MATGQTHRTLGARAKQAARAGRRPNGSTGQTHKMLDARAKQAAKPGKRPNGSTGQTHRALGARAWGARARQAGKDSGKGRGEGASSTRWQAPDLQSVIEALKKSGGRVTLKTLATKHHVHSDHLTRFRRFLTENKEHFVVDKTHVRSPRWRSQSRSKDNSRQPRARDWKTASRNNSWSEGDAWQEKPWAQKSQSWDTSSAKDQSLTETSAWGKSSSSWKRDNARSTGKVTGHGTVGSSQTDKSHGHNHHETSVRRLSGATGRWKDEEAVAKDQDSKNTQRPKATAGRTVGLGRRRDAPLRGRFADRCAANYGRPNWRLPTPPRMPDEVATNESRPSRKPAEVRSRRPQATGDASREMRQKSVMASRRARPTQHRYGSPRARADWKDRDADAEASRNSGHASPTAAKLKRSRSRCQQSPRSRTRSCRRRSRSPQYHGRREQQATGRHSSRFCSRSRSDGRQRAEDRQPQPPIQTSDALDCVEPPARKRRRRRIEKHGHGQTQESPAHGTQAASECHDQNQNPTDEEDRAVADEANGERTPSPKRGVAKPSPEAELELPLPAGWHCAKGNEAAKGALYYWHESDPEGTLSWDHPASGEAAKQHKSHNKSARNSWTPEETHKFLARCGLAAAAVVDDGKRPQGYVSVDVLLRALKEAASFDRDSRSKLRSECEAVLGQHM